MKNIINVIENIDSSDIEFLVYLRDKIIKKDGYNQAKPVERIINAIEELKRLVKNQNNE